MTKQFKQVIGLHYLGPIKSFKRAKTKIKMSKFHMQRQSLGSHRNVVTRCSNYAETRMSSNRSWHQSVGPFFNAFRTKRRQSELATAEIVADS